MQPFVPRFEPRVANIVSGSGAAFIFPNVPSTLVHQTAVPHYLPPRTFVRVAPSSSPQFPCGQGVVKRTTYLAQSSPSGSTDMCFSPCSTQSLSGSAQVGLGGANFNSEALSPFTSTSARSPRPCQTLPACPQTNGCIVSVGSRVQALFEEQWYMGTVVGIPEGDPEGFGRWTVQCDSDEEGLVSFVQHIRAPVSTNRLPPPRSHGGSDQLGAGLSDQPKLPPVVTQETGLNGEVFFVVRDGNGEELGAFGRAHIAFELQADADSMRTWVENLSSELLTGLLSLLVSEIGTRGSKMKVAESRRNELRSIDDYHFFGLEPSCSDQDLERAYRRVSARLHPDKGGDERSFSHMRQRYDRLRILRGMLSHTQGGKGAISWDHNDRSSLLAAHNELQLQLFWITRELIKIEQEIEEVSRLSKSIICLEDEPVPSEDVTTLTVDDISTKEQAVGSASSGQEYPSCSNDYARESLGTCMLCLEVLQIDPREIVNMCCNQPRCRCLVHRACLLNPDGGMNDHLRRCMICKTLADPELVRLIVRSRERRSG